MSSDATLSVWRTIKIGTGIKTTDDFRLAFKQSGCNIGDLVEDILGKPAFTVRKHEKEIDLVAISVKELGFHDPTTRQKIYKRAQRLGLRLCPAEVGPQLRLQYKDQPKGAWLYVGMKPITDSMGNSDIFNVWCDNDGLWLHAHTGYPGRPFWHPSYRWVFVLSRE